MIAFFQIEVRGVGFDKIKPTVIEISSANDAAGLAKTMAELVKKTVRVCYPSSETDSPANHQGHYFNPKIYADT